MNWRKSLAEKKRSTLIVGCLIAVAGYWILESILDTYIFSRTWRFGNDNSSFLENLLTPSIGELWDRLVIISGFIVANVFAYTAMMRQRIYEDTIQEEADFVKAVLDTAPALIIVLDKDGRVVKFNKTCEQALGYTLEEVQGKKIWDLFIEAEDNTALKQVLEHLSVDATTVRKESYWRKKSGEKILIAWSNAVLRGRNRAIKYIIGTGVNITERKEVEDRLEASAQEIRNFAYSVIHDLKSPTIGVHGITNLLNRNFKDLLPEKGQQYCEQILRTTEQIAALVEQINTFITTKELPLDVEAVKLKNILQLIRDEFAARLSVRQVRLVEPEKLPEISGDRVGILRIFRNLVDNALKYGGEKLTEIRISYNDNNISHILSISDNGIGIEMKDPDKIFGIFQRHETSKGIAGSGIGLATVREIARKHGGDVWVESSPGEGTTFFISMAKNLSSQKDLDPPLNGDSHK